MIMLQDKLKRKALCGNIYPMSEFASCSIEGKEWKLVLNRNVPYLGTFSAGHRTEP